MKKINIDISKIISSEWFDIKNLSKDLIYVLILVWIVVIVVFSLVRVRLNAMYAEGREKIDFSKTNVYKPIDTSTYIKLLDKMSKPEKLSYYDNIIGRDMFFESKKVSVVVEQPVFEIKNIERIPLTVMYKGYIEREDGTLAAQLNWDGETRFVKSGDKIKGYKIFDVAKDAVIITGPDNKKIVLKHNKTAFSDDFQVVFFDSVGKKSYTLKKGDTLGGKYKIIDISNDSVILLTNNEKIILKKGERVNG